MAKKLYVGGISYGTNDQVLGNYFAQAGTVESAVIIKDRMSGRSKGFGFVEMSTEEEAQKAIEMFNGQELEGRKLIVTEARPMGEKPPHRDGGFNRGGNGGGRGRSYRD
jgi:RNA recognition motif-containing protein